jgi:hypothetical protein
MRAGLSQVGTSLAAILPAALVSSLAHWRAGNYLGSRFAWRTPEAVEACAHWCDVVSFNLYKSSIANDGDEWARFHARPGPRKCQSRSCDARAPAVRFGPPS